MTPPKTDAQPQNETSLAEPFSRLFVDWAEANLAFDLLRDATRQLRAIDPYDTRLAVTLSQRSGRLFLRLNFGGWLVLGFRGPGRDLVRVDMALLANKVAWDERFTTLTSDRKEGEPDVRSYELPISMLSPITSDLQLAFEATLDFIANKFQHWKKATHWKQHNPELVEAFFDPEKRALLFAGGLEDFELRYERHYTAFDLELAEEGTGYGIWDVGLGDREIGSFEVAKSETSHFSKKTFELLENLHHNPNRNFYQLHKDEFKLHVEKPFKQLFHLVADQLPSQITHVMETEKRLFSRILKNDFGQGGAWDFYWGAFYPKGGKRTSDAQLSMWINYERLEFGFYVGDYGDTSRNQLQKNCQKYYEELVPLFRNILSRDEVIFGQGNDIVIEPDGSVYSKLDLTWQEWLKNPAQANFDLSIIYPKEKVLQFSSVELSARIANIYTDIFPLVLLAINPDPLPVIYTFIDKSSNDLPALKPKSPIPNPPSPIPHPQSPIPNPIYPLPQLTQDTSLDADTLSRWVRAIERKKQVVLYGPPGTGKTYIAEKLAQHLIGGGNGFIDVIQFHPAYAYEDFIQGIRPRTEDGQLHYDLVPGRFLEFCTKAEGRGVCVLIIDEINRANLSRVFGELMYLLEYRDRAIPLAGGRHLQIPGNVYLIGTMNTADRSIALVDHALRRRFAFLKLYPNYEVLRRFHAQTDFAVDGLIKLLQRLNNEIEEDYHIGVTFFLDTELPERLPDIWQMEIEPYLEEYFFDRRDQVDAFRWEKIKATVQP